MKVDVNGLAEATADVIDEMLELDGRASIAWRQAARALRAGEVDRALELLDEVGALVAVARSHAESAARGIFTIVMVRQLERTCPDKATGPDLEQIINLTTHPHAKNGTGEN